MPFQRNSVKCIVSCIKLWIPRLIHLLISYIFNCLHFQFSQKIFIFQGSLRVVYQINQGYYFEFHIYQKSLKIPWYLFTQWSSHFHDAYFCHEYNLCNCLEDSWRSDFVPKYRYNIHTKRQNPICLFEALVLLFPMVFYSDLVKDDSKAFNLIEVIYVLVTWLTLFDWWNICPLMNIVQRFFFKKNQLYLY